MNWVIKNPERFIQECSILDNLTEEVDWLTHNWIFSSDGEIEVHLDINVHGKIYEARMVYPSVFPNAPPSIRPRISDERWSIHQFGAGGSLCLEWRADNWHPDVTGAEIIKSAYTLLHTEQAPENPGVVPSAHRLTEGQSARSQYYRFIITNDVTNKFLEVALQQKVLISTKSFLHISTQVGFITGLTLSDEESHVINDLPSGILGFSSTCNWKAKGWFFKSEKFNTTNAISSIEDLILVIKDADLDIEDVAIKDDESGKYTERVIVLMGTGLESLRIFTIESFGEVPLKNNKIIMPPILESRLPDDHLKLSQLKIGIIGLGSIGSKVAVSLARSGIQKFILVDDDYLVPGNLVRHELSWGSVGMHKVNALEESLKLIAANLDIAVLNHRIAGQESPLNAAKALKDLSECDLLIDATANPEVFLHLSAIANASQTPICWGEVFAGGYGGLIARARPDLDPNPISVRDSLYNFLANQKPAPFKNATGYDVDEEKPLLSYDSNVGYIASSLTSLAIDTALMRTPSHYPYPIYLLGMQQEWIFTQPFDTRPIEVSGPGWSDATTPSDEKKLEAFKLLMEKLEKGKSAEFNPSA